MSEKEKTSQISVVDEILQIEQVRKLVEDHSEALVVDAIHSVLDEVKRAVMEMSEEERKEKASLLEPNDLVPLIAELVAKLTSSSTKRVINATGVVSSPLLGQPCLSPETSVGLSSIATGYTNSELDLTTGRKCPYGEHAEEVLCNLTKSETASITVSGEAALYVALKVMAAGKDVVVSRQDLVEISDVFRIPDIITESGSFLRAIGTVNKTYAKDYLDAFSHNAAILLKVTAPGTSRGETTQASDLARFADEHGVPFVQYLDYGTLIDLSSQGYSPGPVVKDCVKIADIVIFEGQKLLGSPRAGVILGKKKYLFKIERDPLAQVLRIDKLALAGLENNLASHLNQDQVVAKVPVFSMLIASPSTLKKRALELAKRLEEKLGSGWQIKVEEKKSEYLSGALPQGSSSTYVVVVKTNKMPTSDILTALRQFNPPVVAGSQGDKIVLDVRTIRPEEVGEVTSSFNPFI